MLPVIEIRGRRQRRKPLRLLYRHGHTHDEVRRLIEEIGRSEVEGVLKALDLLEPTLTPAE